jgi:hypothetical protein
VFSCLLSPFPPHPETRRVVEAVDCAELVDALALVTVLAVDPTRIAVADPPDPPVAPAPAASRAWSLGVGTGAASALGVTPGALPVLPAFLEAERRGVGRVRLGVRWGRRTSDAAVGSATFAWTRVQLDGCPDRAAIGRGAVAAGVCAGLQVGALRGEGAGVAEARAASRPWLAAVVAGRLRWRASSRWFAELEAAAVLPQVRDRFYFMPDTTIHRVPPAATELAVSLGVSIP